MLLKTKNLENHLCDYELGGREFESLRARHLFTTRVLQIDSGRLARTIRTPGRQTRRVRLLGR